MLGGTKKNWRYLRGLPVEGCTLSEEERASRRRVIISLDDPRLQEVKFKEAVVVVASNDARYQINKDMARQCSQEAGVPLYWSVARDEATSAALQADPCDKDAKIRRVVHSAKRERGAGCLALSTKCFVTTPHSQK